MGGPLGTKRRGTSSVAGRYLAAIGAGAVGACGDLDNQTLSPLGAAACADYELPTNGGHKRKNSATITPQLQQTVAPKTPTKKDPRRSPFLSGPSPFASHSAKSPNNMQSRVQQSPSLAGTATTGDFSHSMATSASPARSKSRGTPSKSPVSYAGQNNQKASKFFNIFPSTKIALRTSNSKRQKDAIAAAAVQPPPPPQPQPKRQSKDGSSSAAAFQTPTYPQHMQQLQQIADPESTGDPHVEHVLEGATPPAAYPLTRARAPRRSPDNFSSGASAVLSDIFSAAGAPTEVMTNRASDRRYDMDPEDALWRENKSSAPAVAAHPTTSSRSHGYLEDDLAEEKKQDSDAESFRSREEGETATPNTNEDDLLLFGPVPFERTITRRTSNRGNFSQPRAQYPAVPHAAHAQAQAQAHQPKQSYAQYLVRSSPTTRPHSSPRQHQQVHYNMSSPRLNQHLNNNSPQRTNAGAYVRRNPKNEPPVDTKSLLSNSTSNSPNDESSSVRSPPSMLNPIQDDEPASSPGTGNTKSSNHWWSADKVKANNQWKSPLGGAVNQQAEQQTAQLHAPSPTPSKAVVAYPDSPPPYLKPQKDIPVQTKDQTSTRAAQSMASSTSSGNKKVDDSIDSEAGVIGFSEDDGREETGNIPAKPAAVTPEKRPSGVAASIRKLAPSKLDHNTKNHASSTPTRATGKTSPLRNKQIHKPQVNLKPRTKNRSSSELAGDAAEPNRSIVSESSCFTPVAMSEDGLNFSSEKEAPLLPLFSQDRFDFGSGDSGDSCQNDQQEMPTETTRLEQKLVRKTHEASSDQDHQQKLAPQPAMKHELSMSVPLVSPEQEGEGHASRPSPEIWRRGANNDEMNSMHSADPIFCTQPSASLANSTMISSVAQNDSQFTSKLNLSPIAKVQSEVVDQNTLAPGLQKQCPGQKNTNGRWPPSKPSSGHQSAGKPPTLPQRRGGRPVEPFTVPKATTGSQGIPKRSASGPAVGNFRSGHEIGRLDTEDVCTVSSRQVETGACHDSPNGSTGSLPRRSKSEMSGIKTGNEPQRTRGAFHAAFAAFEKASTSRNDGYSLDGDQVGDSKKPSRLAMVLNAHLAREACETADDQVDVTSVDIQSIRSNFEAAGNFDAADDDDDDTASVKSLREVFEAVATDQSGSETAVSKMRSLFENQRPPAAKNFETANVELKGAWDKFEVNSSRPRRTVLNKSREAKPAAKPPRLQRGSGAGKQLFSVADRAKMFESKTYDQEIDVAALTNRIEDSLDNEDENVEYGAPKNLLASQHETMPSPDLTVSSISAGNSNPPGKRKADGVQGAAEALTSRDDTHPPSSAESKDATVERRPTEKKAALDDGLLKASEHSKDVSIPSDRIAIIPENGQEGPSRLSVITSKIQATPASASSSEEIVSPPRLGIQSGPRGNRVNKVDYLPKDFSPRSRSSRSKSQGRQHAERDTVTASEGEFSDGVTLDLSIADVSQLTNPTYLGSKAGDLESKAGDNSTLGDVSTGEKTVEIDLEAKRSEASSSQQTEAAAPLIASAMKRLSDDTSLESRTQMAKLWGKSALLGPSADNIETLPEEEEPEKLDNVEQSGWDVGHVESSFPPVKDLSTEEAFFGLEEEPAPEWQAFENDKFWSPHPDPADDIMQKNEARLGSSSGQSRDPDGLRFDRKSNTSIHITEVPHKDNGAASQYKSAGRESSSHGQAHQSGSPGKRGSAGSAAKASPRSQIYREAKLHAKSMLAARSPKRNSGPQTPTRSSANPSPHFGTPKSLHSRATSTTSPSSTPPRVPTPGFRPVTPTSHPITPTSSSLTPKSFSKTPSSRPITPTQRSITPTINNLRDRSTFRMTPKVHRRDVDPPSSYAGPTQRISNPSAEPWMPNRHDVTSSPHFEEFKHDDFFSAPSPAPQVHVFAAERFSSPAFEESKVSFTASADEDFFLPPTTHSRDMPSHSPARVPQGAMFSRTHPASHDYIRQKKHSSAAHVQSFRNNSFATPQDNFSRPSSSVSAKPVTKGSQPSGRLAAVVGKHAALMARLRVLKAARIRRTTDSSPYGHEHLESSASDVAVSNRPKSSIGRAIASVYKSRRSSSSTNYVQTKYGSSMTASASAVHTPRAEPTTTVPKSLVPSQQPPAFDPFNPAFPEHETNDDCFSESTWESSTGFGGEAFVAALELD